MKSRITALIVATAGLCLAHAQGTLVFDQQSSTQEGFLSANTIMQEGTAGQAFRPTLPGIDFVRLMVGDRLSGNGVGATLSLTLRDGSPGGLVLSSTDPVGLVDGFKGIAHFAFPSTVSLTPGETYVFETSITSDSDWWGINSWAYGYDGGMGYWNGVPNPASDLWFREGIVAVPEPSAVCLGLLGLATLALGRCTRRRDREVTFTVE
jgi:hypothetical protein